MDIEQYCLAVEVLLHDLVYGPLRCSCEGEHPLFLCCRMALVGSVWHKRRRPHIVPRRASQLFPGTPGVYHSSFVVPIIAW